VEIAFFSPIQPPNDIAGWFRLLQNHRLLGLAYLGVFDVLNAVLVGLMLLALFAALRRFDPGQAAIAGLSGLLGIAVLCASNTALSILSLSHQFTAETGEAQRTALLTAGRTLMALNRFSSPGAHPGSGGYLSLLLIATSSFLFSLGLLRSRILGKWTGVLGLFASVFDLFYCITFPIAPAALSERLAVLCIPAGGLFWMAWHLMVGCNWLRHGRLLMHNDISGR
jgi:hypothetical protein